MQGRATHKRKAALAAGAQATEAPGGSSQDPSAEKRQKSDSPFPSIKLVSLSSAQLFALRQSVAQLLLQHAPRRAPAAIYNAIQTFVPSMIDELTPEQEIINSLADSFLNLKENAKRALLNKEIIQKNMKELFSFMRGIERLEQHILNLLNSFGIRVEMKIVPFPLKEQDYLTEEKKEENVPIPEAPMRAFLPSRTTHIASGLIEEEADIYTFPQSHGVPLTSNDSLVEGDLHACLLKLIYKLIRENVLTGINEQEYAELVRITKNRAKTIADLKLFYDIFCKLKPTDPGNSPWVKLIGDIFADRFGDDLLTLKFLRHLRKNKVPYIVFGSNHDRELIHLYSTGALFEPDLAPWRCYYTTASIPEDNCLSLLQLGEHLAKGFTTPEEVRSLIEEDYLPFILPYQISTDISPNPKELIFYDHAPVGLNIIPKLKQELHVDGNSPASLNEFFSLAESVKDTILRIIRNKQLPLYDRQGTWLFNLMWNRPEDPQHMLMDNFPGRKIIYVHGHHGDGQSMLSTDTHVDVNLDNSLGKALNLSKGTYTLFYAGHNPEFLAARKRAVAKLAQTNAAQISLAATSQAHFKPAAAAANPTLSSDPNNKDPQRPSPSLT